jgi:hypothetical protein
MLRIGVDARPLSPGAAGISRVVYSIVWALNRAVAAYHCRRLGDDQLCLFLDEVVLKVRDSRGKVRQGRVGRGLDATLGPLRFRRWRVKAQGKTTCLLDGLLGLERGSPTSLAVKKRASELTSRMTYREAAQVLSEEVGTPISRATVRAWVQAIGRGVEERELVASLTAPEARRVVVIEWDDAPLRSREKGRQDHGV